jgi:mono/diheme cytochrome c family protein
MRIGRIFLALLAIVVIGAAAFVAWAWESPVALLDGPDPSSIDHARVQRGAELAAMGNCPVCHTTEAGKPYAGGRGLPTPFGTIYATNITPDLDTGIGRWSKDAFARAMREGVGRAGEHLYPAFPYDHFTRLTDDDVDALYAFLMTREPVRAQAPANDVVFPLNIRMMVAGWKLLFFREGAPPADPGLGRVKTFSAGRRPAMINSRTPRRAQFGMFLRLRVWNRPYGLPGPL